MTEEIVPTYLANFMQENMFCLSKWSVEFSQELFEKTVIHGRVWKNGLMDTFVFFCPFFVGLLLIK